MKKTTTRRYIMAENRERKEKVQNYIESDQEREEGHQDTRKKNFECDTPDEHLGCDMGIDVQG
jgi:hypothetical protein